MKRLTTYILLFLFSASAVFGALPTITFNNATGSDTQASGAGPATALFGSNPVILSNDVDLSASAPDLSGVATDGSAVFYSNASTLQNFAKITAVNDGTDHITIVGAGQDETPTAWAIGGKRKTLEAALSRKLFTQDAKAGWTIVVEDAQTITTAINLIGIGSTAVGPIIFKGLTEGIVITQSGSANHFTSSGGATLWRFENFKFTNSNGTKTNAHALNLAAGTWFAKTCIFGDATNTIATGILRAGTALFNVDDCDFVSCSTAGISLAGSYQLHIYGSRFKANAVGMLLNNTVLTVNAENNLFYSGTGDAIRLSAVSSNIRIINNTFHGNTSDALDISAGIFSDLVFRNNILTANGTGINAASGQTVLQDQIDYNNFGTGATANTTARTNINAGTNDLAVDPAYVNAAGENFQVGAAVSGMGFPLKTRNIGANQSATKSYVDMGAAQAPFPDNGAIY